MILLESLKYLYKILFSNKLYTYGDQLSIALSNNLKKKIWQ